MRYTPNRNLAANAKVTQANVHNPWTLDASIAESGLSTYKLSRTSSDQTDLPGICFQMNYPLFQKGDTISVQVKIYIPDKTIMIENGMTDDNNAGTIITRSRNRDTNEWIGHKYQRLLVKDVAEAEWMTLSDTFTFSDDTDDYSYFQFEYVQNGYGETYVSQDVRLVIGNSCDNVGVAPEDIIPTGLSGGGCSVPTLSRFNNCYAGGVA